MMNPFTWISRHRHRYEPLITVRLSRSALLHNLAEFRRIAPSGQVAPVLKSNAYGHGLFEVARILEHDRHIPFFVVDSYFEALALRSAGIRTPILIIGYTRPETMETSRLRNVAFTVTSLAGLQSIEDIEHPISIHLKIDTGMRRQGITPDEIDRAIELIAENSYIRLTGICSHLCDADDPDPSFTEGQIHIWNNCVSRFKSKFATLRYIHISATDGHRYSREIDANISRLGIGLYGLVDGSVFSPALDLKPVLEMRTVITGIRKLARDETIGYGNSFRSDHELLVATIPVGYYEGLDRRLSSNGSVGIAQERVPCRIIGRVSMNIATIDVTTVGKVHIGTTVTVISNNPADENSLIAMARRCGAITYELAVHIPAHLKRIVVE